MVARLRPHRQGSLDALCGPYAVVNAMTIILAPHMHFNRGHAASLLSVITADMDRRGKLQEAMHCGAWPGEVWRCAKVAARRIRDTHGVAVDVSRPFRKARFSTIDDLIAVLADGTGTGAAFIIEITGQCEHWTVVRRTTDRSLLLRDSAGMRSLRRVCCGLERGGRVESVYAGAPRWVVRERSIIRIANLE